MVFKIKEKSFAEKNVHIRFAIFPVWTGDKILWLERYYVYTNTRKVWRARFKDFSSKEDFYIHIWEV